MTHSPQKAFGERPLPRCMGWSTEVLTGPDGEDWRVPTSELEMRQSRFITALDGKSAWVNDPVDMYWLVGNRQAGGVHISSDGNVTQYVKNSLERAQYEAGGEDAPHEIVNHPRMSSLSDSVSDTPALQLGRMPASDAAFLQSKLGEGGDCTQLLWTLREIKSDWEIEQNKSFSLFRPEANEIGLSKSSGNSNSNALPVILEIALV